jgi:hypothetical protein
MKKSPATNKVAAFLQEEKRRSSGHKISTVIDRLLACGDSLESAYHELIESAGTRTSPGMTCERWQMAIMALVEISSYWNPEAIKETREAMRRINDLNTEIAEKASKLAELLHRRSELATHGGGIENPGNPLVYELLEPAAYIAGDQTGYLYRSWVNEHISALAKRFDYKYWPTCADLLEALAETQDIEPITGNNLTAAAIEASQKSSNLDFMRSLDQGLQNLAHYHNTLVCLSSSSYAALINAALDLGGEITPEYVDTYRSRERQRKRFT